MELPEIIDETEPEVFDELMAAFNATQIALEVWLDENYPIDTADIIAASILEEEAIKQLEALLSLGLEPKLTALQDKSENNIIFLLALLTDKTKTLKTLKALNTNYAKPEIKQIISEQRKAIQVAGTSRRNILDSIGLSPAQTRSLKTYRQQLEQIAISQDTTATLDTNTIRNLSASQRSVIRSAIARGIEPADVDGMVNKQRKALFSNRLKAISNNVTSTVAHAAQQGLLSLANKAGLVKPGQLKRHWMTAGDERVRHSHSQVPGMNPGGVDIEQPFKTPFGAVMYPPLEINCRCRVSVRKA